MTIKVELKETPVRKLEMVFPCIGVSKRSGMVVLFTGRGVGTVLKEATKNRNWCHYAVGHHSETWCLTKFDILPAGSTITLTVE